MPMIDADSTLQSEHQIPLAVLLSLKSKRSLYLRKSLILHKSYLWMRDLGSGCRSDAQEPSFAALDNMFKSPQPSTSHARGSSPNENDNLFSAQHLCRAGLFPKKQKSESPVIVSSFQKSYSSSTGSGDPKTRPSTVRSRASRYE